MAFNPAKFVEEALAEIRERVGKGKAIVAMSGGVNSTVTAVLMTKALGERSVAVFVDTGYMRKGEPERLKEVAKKMGMKLRFVDAREEYYAALKGVEEPERKRKVIGEKFIRIFEKVATEEKAEFLGQGTLPLTGLRAGAGCARR